MAKPEHANVKATLKAIGLRSFPITLIVLFALPAHAQEVESRGNSPPAPPTDATASDTPNVDGSGLTVTWIRSGDGRKNR